MKLCRFRTRFDAYLLTNVSCGHGTFGPNASPRSGVTSFVLKRFDLEQFLWNILHHKIFDMIFIPPVAVDIINSSLTKKYSFGLDQSRALRGRATDTRKIKTFSSKALSPRINLHTRLGNDGNILRGF